MQNIYSVSQINSYIKNMFAQDYLLRLVSVRGEISKVTYHSSGHIYFSVKDEGSVINAVMYSRNKAGLEAKLSVGLEIVMKGSVQVYDKAGTYQFNAISIKEEGHGALQEEFEKLKIRLEEKGLFSPMYKQPIPKYVRRLGIVTASTGAAVRDIIQITKRRNPYVEIILYPSLVQGDSAPLSIIKGIETLDKVGVDVIIVGRGGGSMEDLWCFNDENLAETIFNARTPIISAVGHEIDFTIADFVSDLRAPTPSAAAELAIFDVAAMEMMLEEKRDLLNKNIEYKLKLKKNLLQKIYLKLEKLSPSGKLKENKAELEALRVRLENDIKTLLEYKKKSLVILSERLKGVSPLDKLNQGYAWVVDSEGKNINSVDKVEKDDILTVTLKDGSIKTKVLEKEYE